MSAVVCIFLCKFTKWPQILISMLRGQYTVALQEQCPWYLVATSPESLLQQDTLSTTGALSHDQQSSSPTDAHGR